MTRNLLRADRRRRFLAPIASGALTLLVIAVAGAPAVAAAPTVHAFVADGTLRILGSVAPDRLTLRLDKNDSNQLQVDVADDGSADFSFGLDTFAAIDIAAGNGDDTVLIDQTFGAFTTLKPTRIDGGNGDDNLNGGSGAEFFTGGRGNDVIDGNGGADTAFLGRGNDSFVWDPGDGSDIVEGQSGFDTMVFNGAGGNEIMAATADGGRVLFTRNLGTIVMDLNDVEGIDVRALGGTDTVTVNDVRGTDLRRVDVDLAADLGGSTSDFAADTVKVVGTAGDDSIAANADGGAVDVSGLSAFVRITHADVRLDTLVIDSLAGADNVAVDPALAGLIQVIVP
jgi:RTX calcium-binding nonapeptide repeat (4 copies)